MSTLPAFVLITPARNEALYIEQTIQAVVSQTVRPLKWVIVDDGSTDATGEIVRKYQDDHPWIEQIRMPARRERHFAGKAHAFNAGYETVTDLRFDFVGCLDADVLFDDEYCRFLIDKLAQDAALGLVGTRIRSGSMYDYRFVSIEHVSGSFQMFRRACLEQIGGYVPAEAGGVDHIAAISARMHGWKTRTFLEMVATHQREMGSVGQGPLTAKFRVGAVDYTLGSHPLWECCRALYQMTRRPLIVGGLAILAGYLSACLARPRRPVSREMVAFHRREQMRRLKMFFFGIAGEPVA